MTEPIWTPDLDRRVSARITHFRKGFTKNPDLYAAALADLPGFWDAVWQYGKVIGDRGTGPAVIPESGQPMRETQFFPEAKLSYAENLLAPRKNANIAAVVYRREDGLRRILTWDELRGRVATLAHWLRARHVGPGDVVAAWLPNNPETLITMLAANACGATFTSTSPDFGVAGVVDRFSQVAPKVLVACDGYHYGGKVHDRISALPEVLEQLPSVTHGLVVAEAGDLAWPSARLNLEPWESAAEPAEVGFPPEESFERFGFDHPGFILYSSGTTGKPKCIEHSAAGLLLKHLSEHQLHCDVRAGDVAFYYTTCGWMMWNWLMTALASGATIVLYDGSPFHPDKDILWDLAQQEGVTLFGTSAKYLDASRKAGAVPRQTHDLRRLRTITSTGSPLSAEGYEYVYSDVHPDVHLASISGGTDLCGCFVLGDPTKPVYPGQIQTPALGMAVDVLNEDRRSLRHDPGVTGELVCTAGFPTQPLLFVGDDDGSKYEAAYYSDFPGIWAHGDFASWTQEGGLVIHGRSDATLNAGGVRIGTAEIYRQVESLPEVIEALAVGQEWDDDTRIVLFVRVINEKLTAELEQTIKRTLRTNCSPRHVPARILSVPDMPRTRSGKLAELAVRDVIHERPVRNTAGLANPAALAHFSYRVELQS